MIIALVREDLVEMIKQSRDFFKFILIILRTVV